MGIFFRQRKTQLQIFTKQQGSDYGNYLKIPKQDAVEQKIII